MGVEKSTTFVSTYGGNCFLDVQLHCSEGNTGILRASVSTATMESIVDGL